MQYPKTTKKKEKKNELEFIKNKLKDIESFLLVSKNEAHIQTNRQTFINKIHSNSHSSNNRNKKIATSEKKTHLNTSPISEDRNAILMIKAN